MLTRRGSVVIAQGIGPVHTRVRYIMSVSRICLALTRITIVASLVASPALAAPLTGDGWSASMANIVAASDKVGQGWFGG